MLRFSLLVVGMMAVGASMAGGVLQCAVDTVPIQITDDARRADNARYGPVTSLSAAKLSDPHFRAFVTAVTEHVAARLGKENLCIDSAESKKQSLLQFVNWPLFNAYDKPPTPVESLDTHPSNGCRISSPWMDLAIERKPVPWIRGIVRWNERQLLADQAVLAGVKNVPPGVAMPLTNSEFGPFVSGYERSELWGQQAAKPIEEHIPPDLLWLLRRSPQSTTTPFIGLVSGSMHNAMEKGAEGYTKLVIALIDRCFAADGSVIYYNEIFDVADPILLEQYRIDTRLY